MFIKNIKIQNFNASQTPQCLVRRTFRLIELIDNATHRNVLSVGHFV